MSIDDLLQTAIIVFIFSMIYLLARANKELDSESKKKSEVEQL